MKKTDDYSSSTDSSFHSWYKTEISAASALLFHVQRNSSICLVNCRICALCSSISAGDRDFRIKAEVASNLWVVGWIVRSGLFIWLTARNTCQKLYSFSPVLAFCRTTARQRVLLQCASSLFCVQGSQSLVRLADSPRSPSDLMKNADMFSWTKHLNQFSN